VAFFLYISEIQSGAIRTFRRFWETV